MESILNILNKISGTRSINEKINILKNIKEPILQSIKYILNVTYNPYKIFDIGKASLKELKQNKNIGSGSKTEIDRFVLFLECQIDKTECSDSDLNELVNILSELRKDIADLCLLILNKNLKIGMATKTINKAIPNLIPEFNIQSCVLISDVPRGRYLVSPRFSGLRCIAIPQRDNYRLFSEQGRVLDFPEVSNVLNDYCGRTNLVFDGILTSLKYNIMDSIYLTEWISVEVSNDPMFKRYSRLLDILSSFNSKCIQLIPHVMVDNEEDVLEFYSYCLGIGFKGIVLKDFLSCYEKRKTWLEMKLTENYVLTIVDCIEGIEKNTLDSFAVNFNGIIINIEEGMSDDQRKEFWNDKEKMLGKAIEIEADSVTKDGGLKFPRFKNLVRNKGAD